jgi:hypothetical protein
MRFRDYYSALPNDPMGVSMGSVMIRQVGSIRIIIHVIRRVDHEVVAGHAVGLDLH